MIDLTQFSTEQLRRAFAESDDKRDAGLSIPADIDYRAGIPYGPDPVYHTLDLCWPKGAEGALPTIVSVHGGGYVYGSAERYRFYCADLAQRGFAVVNFNYRLAPEHPLPAPHPLLPSLPSWLPPHRPPHLPVSAEYHRSFRRTILCQNPPQTWPRLWSG